jgi:hypothetical protein
MKGKSIIKAMLICGLISTMVVSVAGCQSDGIGFPGFNDGKTSLSDATMCKSLDLETGEPVEQTDTFDVATQVIYCSVKVSNATPDTEISAEWLYLPATDDEAGLLISDWSMTMDGTRYIPLSIMRPENGWPQGDYKLVFYLDGKEALSVSFKVQ